MKRVKREKNLHYLFATSVSTLLISRYLRVKPPNYGENKVKRVELVFLEQMWDNGEKMAKRAKREIIRAKREKMRAKRENSPSFSLIILQQAFQSTQVGENKRFTQQNVEISVFAYVFLVWTFFFLPLRLVYHICGLSFIFLNHIHWNSLTWILFTFFAFFTTILPQFGFVWSKPRWPVFFPSPGFFNLLQSNLAFFTHL